MQKRVIGLGITLALFAMAVGAQAQSDFTFTGGTVTSVATTPGNKGDSGIAYKDTPFKLTGVPTFQGAWGDASFGDFWTLPNDWNGGTFYHDSDASKITLRLFVQDIDLTHLNDGGSGIGTFGIQNICTDGFNPKNEFNGGLRVHDQNGYDPDPTRMYNWQTFQGSNQGPDFGWYEGPVGGGVNDPEYDTFDAMIEFAPQADGSVRMYAFERKHESLFNINDGSLDANGDNIWRPQYYGHELQFRFYNVLPVSFYSECVNVYGGIINSTGTPAGGNSLTYSQITARGTQALTCPSCTQIPEPSSLAFLALPLLGLVTRRRK